MIARSRKLFTRAEREEVEANQIEDKNGHVL
jgi:hypothetical protein